jgi:F-type H+-transporting ATPase subunit epsilon
MDEKLFRLDIITPDRVVYRGQVKSFTAPGDLGSFQVLYNHAPLLSSLSVGEMKFVDSGDNVVYYSTSGGFVEVRNNRVLALVQTAEQSDEIDVTRAKEAKERAEKRIKDRKPETDIERAKVALTRAVNRIKVSARTGTS